MEIFLIILIFRISRFLGGLYFYVNKSILVLEWTLFSLNRITYNYLIYLDFIGGIFVRVVLIVSSFVVLYRIDYIGNDKYLKRFKWLLVLFVLAICVIVIRPGFLGILVGWDGLGLVSYCLVIYYQNKNAYVSGIITVLCNRFGDICLLIIIRIRVYLGSWNVILYEISLLISYIFILIIFTKSAQFPFRVWLPAAITAPTPISALVHSSTLVTAGVYIFIRYNKLVDYEVKILVIILSRFTIFIAGLIANYESRLKKIIALSTLSQLGFIIVILRLGIVSLGFFHILVHAFFKSLIFLCVGRIIHEILNRQDLRLYRGFYKISILKCLIFIFSLLNLSGFPFYSGYYRKDLILEYIIIRNLNKFVVILLFIGTILTLSYRVRIIKFIMGINLIVFEYRLGGTINLIIFRESILIIIVIFFGYYYFNIFIVDIIIITEYEKNFMNNIYIFILVFIFSFFIRYKLLNLNKKLVNIIIRIFYLSNLYKIIYLDLMVIGIIFEKSSEKFLNKILGLRYRKIFYFQDFFPYILNWKFFVFIIDLIKFYVIILIIFFLCLFRF